MFKSKIKNLVLVVSCIVLLSSTAGTGSIVKAEPTAITEVTETFETTQEKKSNYDYQAEQTKVIDGTEYQLVSTTFKVTDKNKKEKMEQKEITKEQHASGLDFKDESAFKDALEVTAEDGKKISLTRKKVEFTENKRIETKTATAVKEYGWHASKPEIDKNIKVPVKDERNQKNILTDMSYQSLNVSKKQWITEEAPYVITISDYDKDYILFEGEEIKVTEQNPLQNYHKLILKHLGYSSSDHKILSIQWSGKEYTNKKGITCRQLVCVMQSKAQKYTATYSGNVPIEVVTYDGTATYQGSYEYAVPEGTVYKVTATNVYQAVQQEKPVTNIEKEEKTSLIKPVILAAVIVLTLGVIVTILFVLRKKKN